MIIGSHLSFGSDGLEGVVKKALAIDANAMMFYTGAPQNTIRKEIDNKYTELGHRLLKENNIAVNNVIVHAPYIINLANYSEVDKYNFSINFLHNELLRVEKMHLKYLVVHPGSSLKLDRTMALDHIILGIKEALKDINDVTILLETMAGKGSECGNSLGEMSYLINELKDYNVGVCLDTCHLNDSGVDLNNFNEYLNDFDSVIGLNKIKCVHLNDSKNPLGSHKDRHENIGFGTIGFDTLLKILNHELLKDVPKILETPYVNIDEKTSLSPYKEEIKMLRNATFNPNLIQDIIKDAHI